jgi:hypothetical protein
MTPFDVPETRRPLAVWVFNQRAETSAKIDGQAQAAKEINPNSPSTPRELRSAPGRNPDSVRRQRRIPTDGDKHRNVYQCAGGSRVHGRFAEWRCRPAR